MSKTKNIIVFYFLVLISMLISSSGIYILDSKIGLIYAALSLFIIPILTIVTVVLAHKKGSK